MTSRILFLILLFWVNVSQAKYIYEYMEDVEPLLIGREYAEAELKFSALDDRVKKQIIRGHFLFELYESTVKYQKDLDKYHSQLSKVESNMALYKTSGDNAISAIKCVQNCINVYINGIDNNKPKSFNFSENFMDHINELRNSAVKKFYELHSSLKEGEKARKEKIKLDQELARKKKIEDALKKREEEKSARDAKKLKDQQELDAKNKHIDNISKSIGYAGYAEMSVVRFIYLTQKNGGIEKYLNKIFGCHSLNHPSCVKWYSKLKAIQILDDTILYSFSEYSGSEHVTFTVLSNKEQGKMYQEGQAFNNGYHAFVGMTPYQTIAGVNKTVPVFKSVNFNQ